MLEEKVCSNFIFLVDGRIFLDGMKHDHVCFALIHKINKEEIYFVLVELLNLLKEFHDIMSDNVPNGLPLMRKISHQMDLILGASFLNKESHRMTLAKNDELNKKVHDF